MVGSPTIGSVRIAGPSAAAGVVVAARPLPSSADGQDRVALRIRTETNGPGGPGTPAPGATPRDSLAGLRAELSEAQRDRDAARPSIARTADRLSPEDRAAVTALRQRDAQVRQEETAHAGVAGSLAGPISYIYQLGPDGRQYAIGGSVKISARTVTGTAEEARQLGGRIAAAALAATNPSAADLSAAAQAYRFAQGTGTEFSAGDVQNRSQSDRPGDTYDRSV